MVDQSLLRICAFARICKANCLHKWSHLPRHMESAWCEMSVCNKPVINAGSYKLNTGKRITIKESFPHAEDSAVCVPWLTFNEYPEADIIGMGLIRDYLNQDIDLNNRYYDYLDNNSPFYTPAQQDKLHGRRRIQQEDLIWHEEPFRLEDD